MKEKAYRSIIKSISWRVLGSIDTLIISYIITERWEYALSIGGIELFTKMLLYFFHERAWNRISIGKESHIEYEI
ncbi:DUF2061 domain-containing protein [Halosquirtibacter xylanolyticus]|uniref:DUF2061 domain-containing protein n=1 Tax=Halosquirtibacter xylanolyticus TaxID=3374599 RepID=UPI0037489F12|nr:DUF2061 domain-containing protein [Prolixibacteraceae bacterium]